MATKDDSKASERDDLSELESLSGSGSDGESDTGEAEQVEWLATTRAKRSTAGNRMKSILANEEPAAEDSDLELLFAEDEDDAGFTDLDKEDASDVHMDSSSDDEDQNEGGDELEGEKELEKQAKEKRKRKAQNAIPMKFRKKVRIEQPPTTGSPTPSSTAAPTPTPSHQPRPKKKSERTSWLPSPADMPTRASDRRTTKISKQQLHEKMVEEEIKRKKQMEIMEKKAKRLEALKKPPMTQAERLAEAASVEKRNAKSLNRWEEAEKQREEERLRKIAALNNRKLAGPVVTFYSGIQELEEGQLKHVGKMVSMEEKAPRKKRQSLAATAATSAAGSAAATPGPQEPEAAKADEVSKPPSPTEETPSKPTAPAVPAIAETSTAPEPPGPSAPGPPNVKTEPSSTPQTSSSAPPEAAAPSTQPPGAAEPPGPLSAPPSLMAPPPQNMPSLAPPGNPSEQQQQQQPVMAPLGSMAPPPPPPPPPLPLAETKQNPSGCLAAPVLAPPSGLSAPMLGGQMPQMPMLGFTGANGKYNGLALPNTSSPGPSPLSMSASAPAAPAPAPTVPKLATAVVSAASTSVAPVTPTPQTPIPSTPLQPTQGKAAASKEAAAETPSADPPMEGKVTRSCIILQNFDENAIKDKQVQTQILFGRKMNKLAKPAHPPLCIITNHPARYRDPKTGLPYYNSYAYREIQRVCRGDYKFSRLVGAWSGSGTNAARGVPERFLDPTKKRKEKTPEPVLKPIEGVVEGEQKQTQTQIQTQEQSALAPAPAPAPAPATTLAPLKPEPAPAEVGPGLSGGGQPQTMTPAAPAPTPTSTPMATPGVTTQPIAP
ncbi:YL1 nuclear protein-domain-containing protein [Diplogelasinospora grovesii]|uniref:YL1 nuclear protein-domain-containing protein n=1 Tax=Diplogelasinospora grovesii TaxID=303347 RepID=A0AAN6NAY9_9PEZI|nr:YL1 nuclear protein-domain-containing protein [Diplogelasinospora grovesii]